MCNIYIYIYMYIYIYIYKIINTHKHTHTHTHIYIHIFINKSETTQHRTSAMISFNIETLNSGENPPLQNSFIKFDVAIATFENLVKMAVLRRTQKRQAKSLELCTNVYLMYLCEVTGAKQHIHKYMVLQCSKLFCYKVSSELIQFWQDSKCSRNRIF